MGSTKYRENFLMSHSVRRCLLILFSLSSKLDILHVDILTINTIIGEKKCPIKNDIKDEFNRLAF